MKKDNPQNLPQQNIGRVSKTDIVQETISSYLDYAMSVIVSRALPDVRDGLKPVHRRILYAMWDTGLKAGAKFRKSATVVGEVLGKYHPHGDVAVYDSLARMAQDFSMRYPLIWGQGNFGCFTKDTKVKLTDGRDLNFEELIKEYQQGKKNYTYTINHSGLISITEIKYPRLTKKNAEIIKVILDNKAEIKCTLNHLFMLSSGEYKEARYLAAGDSLMPLYQKLSEATDRLNRKGYVLIYQNKRKEWVPAHHLADNYNIGIQRYSKTAGRVRHHIDFNKFNNNPNNIIRMKWQEHWQIPYYRKLFNEKITKANKQRVTNNTGKIKFFKVCQKIFNEYQIVNRELFEQARRNVYPYGSATSWDVGLEKYYGGKKDLLLKDICQNHKVLRVEFLNCKEDVYDLTIEGTHNFALTAGVFVHNSIDGDSPAAMRYTENKLTPIAEEMLNDLEKETVNFVPNYDGTLKEPVVLPAKIPNLLLNGSMGIAVGMATNIPPHNLSELCDAITHLIDCPDCNIDDLLRFVKGPDFPGGGIIYNQADIKTAYATGKGAVVMQAKTEIVEDKAGQFKIIVTELPYQVNKAQLLENIANLVQEKKIEGIRDLRDESSKEGIRIVIELKKDSYPKKILNQLYKHTALQDVFHFNTLALIDGLQPRVLTLKTILDDYLKHRQIVVRRRCEFDLTRAKERTHILKGLKIAVDNIDAVVKLIKKSKDREEAKINLIKQFKLTEIQANAILEMRLHQLANLERFKIEQELKEKLAIIKDLEAILSSPKKISGIIKNEVLEMKRKYGDERRTRVIPHPAGEFAMEDLIPNESTIVMITRDGYIKRLAPETFRTQTRGGKGVIGLTTKEEDIVEHLFTTMTHSDVLFFSTRGHVFRLKAYDIPVASRTAKGQAIVNFLQLGGEEKVSAILASQDLKANQYLVMVTKNGVIKKTSINDFAVVRRSGLIAIKLKNDDRLEWVKPSTGKDEVIIVTKQGQSIRFKETDVRAMGRPAAGVRGIKLQKGDAMVGMDIIGKDCSPATCQLLTVMENGFGKRTSLKLHRIQGRGGSGIKAAKVTAKTGKIVAAVVLDSKAAEGRDLIVMSTMGQVIRLPLKSVSVVGRATQGVHLMRFKEKNDRIASVTLL